MLTWLHSLLPHFPHYGYVLVFLVVFLNNLGFPLPGETILLGAGFVLGHTAGSLWQPMAAGTAACFLGGTISFWLGRRVSPARLEKIRWLPLTPARTKRTEQFFKRHGAKTVFLARFIALFPPVAANLLAGMSKSMPWRTFLFYNFTGSAAYTVTYILLGYFFGRQWKHLIAWLGLPTLYLILAGILALGVVGVWKRKPLSRFLASIFSKKGRRK
jgi:membrane-associated protein